MKAITCSKCGKEAEHYAKGLCRKCYQEGYLERKIIRKLKERGELK